MKVKEVQFDDLPADEKLIIMNEVERAKLIKYKMVQQTQKDLHNQYGITTYGQYSEKNLQEKANSKEKS